MHLVDFIIRNYHDARSPERQILLAPCSTNLVEKLTGLQLVKKFSAFYGSRGIITAFTSARHLSLSKVKIQVWGICSYFATKPAFTVRSCQHLAQSPSWRTTPRRLSATAYSIYSQLPSVSEALLLSAIRERAMPWWQGPTYNCNRSIRATESSRWCISATLNLVAKYNKYKQHLRASARKPFRTAQNQSICRNEILYVRARQFSLPSRHTHILGRVAHSV